MWLLLYISCVFHQIIPAFKYKSKWKKQPLAEYNDNLYFFYALWEKSLGQKLSFFWLNAHYLSS